MSELAGTDPDRDKRGKAAEGGLEGNNVGSQQPGATAIPEHRGAGEGSPRLVRTKFDYLPTSDRGKLADFPGNDLAKVNPSGRNLTLDLGTSGDAETRPENVSVDFYIKYLRAQADADVPVGAIVMVGRDLPASEFWLPCDGQSLATGDYPDLHRAIGTTYGSSAGKFSLPDLEARFLRGASDTTAVGTLQEHATGRPVTAFTISVPHLPVSKALTGGGAWGGAARIKGSKEIEPWNSGGNADTRPVNLYLNFYIRVR